MAEGKVAVRRVATKKLMIRFGRGRLGGTTYLDAVTQRALRAGRQVIVVDADAHNPSLSKIYPKARVPKGRSPVDFADMMNALLIEIAEHQGSVSAVVDIGGGQDQTLKQFIRDLDLSGFCKEVGVQATGAYALGPDPDDLKHALSVRDERLLDGENTLLLMSEAAVKLGQNPDQAYAPLRRAPEFVEWVGKGGIPVLVNNLPCIEKVRGLGLSLNDAADGKPGEGGVPLDPVGRFQIKGWFSKFEARHAEAEALDLLP